VQLYTHDGQLLPGEAYTDDNGEFEIAVAEARYGLRVVARGGATQKGGDFVGTLSAYVEPFDAELPVPLNPVTTLADRLRIGGGLTADEAESRIATYLALEPGRSVRADFRHLHDFNSGVFMAAVTDYGSFDALVDELVAEALAAPEAQRRFAPGLEGVEKWASEIAMELIKSAVDEVGSSLAGQILAALGLGDDFSGVLRQLEVISRQLTALQATVDEIARDVKELKVNLAVEVAKELVNDIHTLWFDLQHLDRFSGATLEDEKQRIYNEIDKLYPKRQLISNMLHGNLGTPSPIQIYAEFLRDTSRFYSMQHYNKLRDFVEFYDALNVQLYYLLIEAENWRTRDWPEPSQRVAALAAEIEADRKRYRARLPEPLPNESTFIEIPTLRMWYGKREAMAYPGRLDSGKYGEQIGLARVIVDSEKVPDQLLPEEIRAMSGWALPSGTMLDGGFRGGPSAVVKRGAPAALFPGKAQNIWLGPAHQVTKYAPWAYLLIVNENKYVYKPIDEISGDLFVQRQLGRAEASDDWLPWLYPERTAK